MQQKHKLSIFNRYTVGTLAVLIIAAAIYSVLVIKPGTHDTTAPTKPVTGAATPSEFTFTGAAGWYKGPTNKTSMALFSDDQDHSCFTSIEHKTGTVNVTAKLQNQHDDLSASGGTMTPVDTPTATIVTKTGTQQYELHQFSLTGGSDAQLMGGLELGYLQLAAGEGYLVMQGHCNTADQLPTTIPALQAYRFSE